MRILKFLAVFCIVGYLIDLPLILAWVGFGLTAVSQQMSPCYRQNWFAPVFNYFKERDLSPVALHPEAVRTVDYDPNTYNFDIYQQISENWLEPAVVKNMFPNLHQNLTLEFIAEKLGDHFASTISTETSGEAEYEMNCEGRESMRKVLKIGDAVELVKEGESITIVMPGLARVQKGQLGFKEDLESLLSNVDTKRFGGKFAQPGWKPFGTQFWVSAGNATRKRQGTGMHGDCCASFTVQVAGRKRWISYSETLAHMYSVTMREGSPVAYSSIEFVDIHHKVPHKVNIMEPGDTMYMPEWYFHRVELVDDEPSISITYRDCVWPRNFLRRTNTFWFTAHTWVSAFIKTPERVYGVLSKTLFGAEYVDGYWKSEKMDL